jgi:hypothetical protein
LSRVQEPRQIGVVLDQDSFGFLTPGTFQLNQFVLELMGQFHLTDNSTMTREPFTGELVVLVILGPWTRKELPQAVIVLAGGFALVSECHA